MKVKAYLDLMRAPAALTVLGDTAVGAIWAGRPLTGRRLALPLASALLYWSGMVLNDWADRERDAVERPSGRSRPEKCRGHGRIFRRRPGHGGTGDRDGGRGPPRSGRCRPNHVVRGRL
ncbi:ubiA prenyltransferase family protein [Mycobacterium kansasii]|uniref:UbiA prenyltransferase family protein n=1 Tax=Mycobacterium kansasii TaxID=1768 RepID=A0A1V3XEL7_MYCKA|nr:ubiA prenyltransferase family protein [Mycobacterium kansasii]